MFAGRLERIEKKLESARETPGPQHRFGVSKHRFRLRLLAGDGDAGPFCGIDPLSKWNAWFEEEAGRSVFPASPSPLIYGTRLDESCLTSVSPRSDDCANEWSRGSNVKIVKTLFHAFFSLYNR